MLERIVIQRTRQVKQYEPLKIEIVILPDDTDWEKDVKEAIEATDRLLYPENHEPRITEEDLQKDREENPFSW